MGLIGKMMTKITSKAAGGPKYDRDAAESSLTIEDLSEMMMEGGHPSETFREKQKAKFHKIYGRDPMPGGNDPIFFDPDAKTPTLLTPERMKEIILAKMGKAQEASGGKTPEPTEEEKQSIREAVERVKRGGEWER